MDLVPITLGPNFTTLMPDLISPNWQRSRQAERNAMSGSERLC